MLTKPANKINWKDSNLALFGSDLEKKIKEAAAGKETAWKGLGGTVTFRVWRMEKFQVKDWPRRKHGKFHTGDSYLILNSYQPDPRRERLDHDLHIWIGNESTADEYGTAAYVSDLRGDDAKDVNKARTNGFSFKKMVELDDFLGGIATQHRETQGHESALFLKYFDQKVTYLQGGIESGFRHVEDATEQEPHLYHIKGIAKAQTLRLTQVPLRRDYMNSGDVFVLTTGGNTDVWMWVGKEANKDERNKGREVAQAFCKKGTVKVLEEGVNDASAKNFWRHISSEVSVIGPIKRTVEVQKADDKDDKQKAFVPVLYRTPETPGKSFTKVASAKPTPTGPTKVELFRFNRALLQSKHAYLLDTGFHVYIWIGDQASASIKAVAVQHADSYFSSKKRPILPVSVVKQGRATNEFDEFFIVESGSCCIVL